jgi:hypothetical protein
MTIERDTTPRIRAWLHERSRMRPDPAPLLAAVFAQLSVTPQRRGRWARFRSSWWAAVAYHPPVRRGVAFTVALGLVAGVVVVGGMLIVGRPVVNVGGPAVLPAAPAATARPTPTAVGPIDTAGWTPFTSSRYAVTVGHPADWTETRSTMDWTTGSPQWNQGGTNQTPTASTDQLVGPGNLPTFGVRSMPLPGGMTEAAWIAAYTADAAANCYPPQADWEPTLVDGHSAAIAYGRCFNFAEAIAFVGGRVYVFSLEDTSPPGDPRMLKAFLSTVRLTASGRTATH